MRWLFVKVSETADRIVYHYARESNNPDGVIEFNKQTGEYAVTIPCGNDAGSKWCVEKAESKFRFVAQEGFPDRRWVITG